MFSEEEKTIIVECAKKYNISEVIVFGSSVTEEDVNDLAIGIKGLEKGLFPEFIEELSKKLSRDIDIIDLSGKSLFNEVVRERGIKIYG